jgi:acyl carrier protein
MNSESIVAKLNEILVEGFEIDPDLLAPEARLAKDLELDSLDGVDLVVAIEKAFSCRIQEADARSMETVGDVYRRIEQSLQTGKGDKQE